LRTWFCPEPSGFAETKGHEEYRIPINRILNVEVACASICTGNCLRLWLSPDLLAFAETKRHKKHHLPAEGDALNPQ
jgi:hypothetical protein